MFLKNLTIAAIFTSLFFSGPINVNAFEEITAPDFPSCTAPSGSLKVTYPTGTHGIVGQGEVSGSDSVYLLSNSNVLQCFCAPDYQGVQTNWWKVSSLNYRQISSLKKLGWIYVPSGAIWGLEDSAYMAKNLNYTCGSESGGSNSSSSGGGAGSAPVCDSAKPQAPRLLSVIRKGSSATLTWTKEEMATHYTIYYGTDPDNFIYSVPNTGNVTTYTINSLDPNAHYSYSVRSVNNCMPSDPSGDPQVLGVSTGVLGLAATGNISQIVLLLGLSAGSLLLSIFSRNYGRAK